MRILVGGLAAVVLLRTVATGAGVHSTKVEAASWPGSVPLSVHITSPLGRTGLPGAIRIVAQVSHQPNVALAPVKFFVNDVPAGDDGDGPPYAVEWTDANPFEPTRIRVEATDVLGNSASDAIDLAPFEIVETTGASRVLLEATVKDKTDRFVNGLDASSFRVLEDDEPQPIDLVSVESLPVTYILLVDASQSMHPRMEFVHAAAARLADFLRPKDRVIVAPFGRSLRAITGPTDDRETIAGAIQAIAATGGTAIADGLIEASRLATEVDRRYAIVLVTDGYDENSQAKAEDALVATQKAHAAVYVIGVGGIAGISLKGERALRQIAGQTGGRVFFPSRERELPSVHELVAADVQQRYLITYSPANQTADGAWRRISVLTADPSHRIRARAGYFAPKPPPVRATLEFVAANEDKQPVQISAADLTVFEDGVPQTLDTFHEAVAPISIVLALDASGSMKHAADSVREAATSFVHALRPNDQLALLVFSDEAVMVHDLTTNREWTLSGIDQYKTTGGTALNDAVHYALERLKPAEGRRAIVLLTDGRDENARGTAAGSRHSLAEVLQSVHDVDVTIYAIGLGPNVDVGVLERIANMSGGESFFPPSPAELIDEYRRVIAHLRQRYVISYLSSNAARDGAWHRVDIRSADPQVHITSRGGYLAPVQ